VSLQTAIQELAVLQKGFQELVDELPQYQAEDSIDCYQSVMTVRFKHALVIFCIGV
jgi:hypothetical protein